MSVSMRCLAAASTNIQRQAIPTTVHNFPDKINIGISFDLKAVAAPGSGK